MSQLSGPVFLENICVAVVANDYRRAGIKNTQQCTKENNECEKKAGVMKLYAYFACILGFCIYHLY
jgi:hypothetical protein